MSGSQGSVAMDTVYIPMVNWSYQFVSVSTLIHMDGTVSGVEWV